MKHTLGLFIDPKHQRIVYILAFAIAFVTSFAIFTASYLSNAYFAISSYTQLSLSNLNRQTEAAIRGFDALESLPPGNACTPATIERLRDASFLPDGINEFMFVGNGKVLCTSTSGLLPAPVSLGEPHIDRSAAGPLDLWFDVNLGAFGHRSEYGTILQRGRFAVIMPKVDISLGRPPWLDIEGVYWPGSGIPFHANGTPGLFAVNLAADQDGWSWSSRRVARNTCVHGTYTCMAVAVSIPALLWHSLGWLALAVVFCALLAGFAAGRIRAFLQRYSAFEARFLRNMTPERLVCSYQAVFDTTSREITGCEVLSRWRDIDGSIVYPDRFIPILEREGQMLAFTRMMVRRAWNELSEIVPPDRHLQINFNISPQDFLKSEIPHLLEPFLAIPERFSVAVEIVESDKINFADAEKIIESLRAKGIKTYIDDFGAGYSNLENLAHLSADAVKLDKSFAMAPPHSLMAEMLDFAVQMAHAIGRSIVVEGVETQERLEHLLNGPCPVHFIQGYFISRPVDIRSFVALLAQGTPALHALQRPQKCA